MNRKIDNYERVDLDRLALKIVYYCTKKNFVRETITELKQLGPIGIDIFAAWGYILKKFEFKLVQLNFTEIIKVMQAAGLLNLISVTITNSDHWEQIKTKINSNNYSREV